MVRRLVTDHIQFRSKNMDTHQDYISMYYVRYHILFVSMTPVEISYDDSSKNYTDEDPEIEDKVTDQLKGLGYL